MTEESYGIGAMTVLEADAAMTAKAPADDELSDWLGPRRTPDEKAADRLRDILGCNGRPRAWSGSRNPHGQMPWPEVVCILAGIDPEGPGDADGGYFPFLPGALAAYRFKAYPTDPAGRAQLAAAVSEHVDFLLGLSLPTCHPHVAIKAALDVGLTPPWWPWALKDEASAPLLPDVLEASQRPAEAPGSAASEGAGQTIQSKGGKAAARKRYPNRDEHMAFAEHLFRDNPNITAKELLKALGSRFADLENAFGKGEREPGFLKKLTAMRAARLKA